MRSSSFLVCLVLLSQFLHAQVPSMTYPGGVDYALWPTSAPGSEKVQLVEKITERSKDPAIHDRMITGISKPTFTAFLPEHPTGAAILVAPGGGFRRVVIDKEGLEMAEHFSKRGVAIFVLKYRLATEGHEDRTRVALQDAQRAMRLIRAKAAEFKVDPAKLGVMGFSAGGHVAAMLSTYPAVKAYAPVDSADALDAKPNFQVLVYPYLVVDPASVRKGSSDAAIPNSADDTLIDSLSLEKQVRSDTPQTLLIQADDDKSVPPAHVIAYYSALKKAGVKAELHIFRDGGHGFGIRGASKKPVSIWLDLCSQWMNAIGMLKSE